MTDSARTPDGPARPRGGKRQRLMAAAAQVLHEQGVERTTIADIANVADVPVGNVYYYFKTKDQLVEAAIESHARQLQDLIDLLDRIPEPKDRLRTLLRGWADQRELAVQYGCPFGTLASELDKRADGLDRSAALVMRLLIDWIDRQFHELGHADSHDLALTLFGAYQGMSLLTNTFRDPEIMTGQIQRLEAWLDALEPTPATSAG